MIYSANRYPILDASRKPFGSNRAPAWVAATLDDRRGEEAAVNRAGLGPAWAALLWKPRG